jgi:hypothetical protein
MDQNIENTIDLDVLGDAETFITFEAFKIKRAQKVTESKNPIDNEPRPNRMKKPPVAGIATNPTSFFRHLYIQDEMLHMLIDKYGKERGERTFDGLLNARQHGAFFQQGGIIADEKAGLIRALGKPTNHDYWQYSYYELWKEWMQREGHPINVPGQSVPAAVSTPPPTPKETPAPAPAPTVSTGEQIRREYNRLGGSSHREDLKSKQRVMDIIRKANGSESRARDLADRMANTIGQKAKAVQRAFWSQEFGEFALADIFWSKAQSLNESVINESDFRKWDRLIAVKPTIDKVLVLYKEGVFDLFDENISNYTVEKINHLLDYYDMVGYDSLVEVENDIKRVSKFIDNL